MAWYNVGTVTVTASSATVTGSGTAFLTNVRVGDGFTVTGSTNIYQITNIASDTQLTISPVFTGTAGSGKAYAIVPVQGYVKDLADQARQLILTFGTIVGNNSVTALSNVTGTAGAIPYFTSASVMSTVLLTTSALDSTVGRVTRVGDFGLGTTGLAGGSLSFTGDLNTLFGPLGWRYVPSSATNGPIASIAGYLLIEQISSSYTKQTFTSMVSGRQFWRVYNNGTWLGWTEIADTGNAVMRAGGDSSSISGNLVLSSTASVIRTDTANDSDTKRLQLAGGGAAARDRGAYINISGNEHATAPGMCDLIAGDPTGSAVRIFTGPNAAERARVTDIGNVLINSTADDATNKLQVNGGTISNDIKLRNDGGIIGTNANGLTIYSGVTTGTANTTRLAIRTSGDGTAGGAWIEAYGKDHTVAPGELRLGGVSTGGIGAIRFYSGGQQRGMLTNAGRFLLGSSSGTDDGTSSTLQVTGQASISANLIVSSSTTKRLRITTDSTSVYMQAGESTSSTTANLFLGSSMNSTDGKLIVLGNGRIIINNTVASDDTTSQLQVTGSMALSSNLLMGSSGNIIARTASGSDTSTTAFCGGGASSNTRGSMVEVFGANHATYPGNIHLQASTSAGVLRFIANSSEKMRIGNSGNLLIGTTTDDATNKLQVNGSTSVAGNATITGNIAFTGTGNRITGAFGGSQTDRVLFQTNIADSTTAVGLIPNGTGAGGNLNVFVSSDPTNSSYAQLGATATSAYVTSSVTGTGTVLPLEFNVGGAVRARIATDGRFLINAASDPGGTSNMLYTAGVISALSGFRARAGAGGAQNNVFNIDWNNSTARLWIDSSNVGTISLTSDYRIKQDITTLEADFKDRISKYRVVEYRLRDFNIWRESEEVFQGLIAHEAQEANPKAASGVKDGVREDGAPDIQNLEIIPIVTDCIGATQQLIEEMEAVKEENRILKLQMAAILEHLNLEVDTSVAQTEVDTAPSIEE